jgi:hypothetical protein
VVDAAKQRSRDEIDKLDSVVRELIRHENDLVNQRMSWLVQAQGLLFAALAFAWDKSPKLAVLLSALGIATALSIGMAISLYSPAIRGLHAWWNEHVPEEERKARLVIGLWSPSHGVRRFLRPWRALPLIFIVAWVGAIWLRL